MWRSSPCFLESHLQSSSCYCNYNHVSMTFYFFCILERLSFFRRIRVCLTILEEDSCQTIKQVRQQDAYTTNAGVQLKRCATSCLLLQRQHFRRSQYASIYSTRGIDIDVSARLPNITSDSYGLDFWPSDLQGRLFGTAWVCTHTLTTPNCISILPQRWSTTRCSGWWFAWKRYVNGWTLITWG